MRQQLRSNEHGVSAEIPDETAAKLHRLSGEAGRIASILAQLSSGPHSSNDHHDRSSDLPEVSLKTVRAVIRARRLRSQFISQDLFADPAWDMLLELLQADIAQQSVPITSLCIAAAVPATTALRWLKSMTNQGLVKRRADPLDSRRVFIELAPRTRDSLYRYFAEIESPTVI